MNINPNEKNGQRRIKSFGLYGFKGFDSYHGFDKIFSDFSIEILNPIKQTNLQNYYKKDAKKHIIYCLLCNLDIKLADNNVLDHTISLGHKYNKLFYNFVQNHRKQGNIDYIIFDQWAACRYCDDVIFSNFSTELLSDHITNSIHLDKKRYCLYRVTQYSSNLENKHFAIVQSENKEIQKIVTTPDAAALDNSNRLAILQSENKENQKNVTCTPDAAALNDLNRLFSHYSVEKLNSIDKIDLRNNYAKNFGRETIHCSICEVDIKGGVASTHTDSLTHRRNQLFYNFVQKRCQSGDIDYIALGNNWVLCRYCDHIIIPSFSNEIRISHVQTDEHLDKKQYCLNRIANVQKCSTETESFPSFSTEHHINRVQKDEHFDKKQYCLIRVAGDDVLQKRSTERKSFPSIPTELRSNRVQNDEHFDKKKYRLIRVGHVHQRNTAETESSFDPFILILFILCFYIYINTSLKN